jgi:hypothetical protein
VVPTRAKACAAFTCRNTLPLQIGGDEIKQWAMAVPFVKDGEVIYDAADDKAEKYGPYSHA